MKAETYIPRTPVVVVCGHYGVGKTNFALNLAIDAAAHGFKVTLSDLDVVNPYFRSSDSRSLLEEHGVRLIAPVFAGTNLDSPSLSGATEPAIEQARASWLAMMTGACSFGDPTAQLPPRKLVIIDAGGDDVGATALGRFAPAIAADHYDMLYVVNRNRNLTQEPAEAVEVLREIEAKSHLQATAIVNNTHLKQDTDEDVIARGIPFAQAVADQAGLPLACTTVPTAFTDQCTLIGPNDGRQALYPVRIYVRTPWE
ncbi:MAG: ParA family protein [Gordonibacter sp.]|uniref:nucleotide-binding protein n=1 Tax=Gordonibacter sp. TaxID=1968902 RepID=UPI002FC9A113